MKAGRTLLPALAFALLAPLSVSAQKPGSLMADLMKDVSEVEQKMVGLAKAIPSGKYGYAPSADTRSVAKVVMHVASDNYFLPVAAGTAAPATTGITMDYKTVTAYENRQVTPEAAVQELVNSFTFLKATMKAQTEASMTASKKMFGQEMTGQQMWIMTTTHLHEHLGQLIAYARASGVTPPWSK
jgi:uncharacterized damage-inducible protein DinB